MGRDDLPHRDDRYDNASESLRNDMDEQARERRASLAQDLVAAVESLERGEGHDLTPEYWEELRQGARARLVDAQRAPQAGG